LHSTPLIAQGAEVKKSGARVRDRQYGSTARRTFHKKSDSGASEEAHEPHNVVKTQQQTHQIGKNTTIECSDGRRGLAIPRKSLKISFNTQETQCVLVRI
jgi:hypothetical protein